ASSSEDQDGVMVEGAEDGGEDEEAGGDTNKQASRFLFVDVVYDETLDRTLSGGASDSGEGEVEGESAGATDPEADADDEAKKLEGQERAAKLRQRFDQWFYVISDSSFTQLHKERDELWKDAAAAEGGGAAPAGFPTGLGGEGWADGRALVAPARGARRPRPRRALGGPASLRPWRAVPQRRAHLHHRARVGARDAPCPVGSHSAADPVDPSLSALAGARGAAGRGGRARVGPAESLLELGARRRHPDQRQARGRAHPAARAGRSGARRRRGRHQLRPRPGRDPRGQRGHRP